MNDDLFPFDEGTQVIRKEERLTVAAVPIKIVTQTLAPVAAPPEEVTTVFPRTPSPYFSAKRARVRRMMTFIVALAMVGILQPFTTAVQPKVTTVKRGVSSLSAKKKSKKSAIPRLRSSRPRR